MGKLVMPTESESEKKYQVLKIVPILSDSGASNYRTWYAAELENDKEDKAEVDRIVEEIQNQGGEGERVVDTKIGKVVLKYKQNIDHPDLKLKRTMEITGFAANQAERSVHSQDGLSVDPSFSNAHKQNTDILIEDHGHQRQESTSKLADINKNYDSIEALELDYRQIKDDLEVIFSHLGDYIAHREGYKDNSLCGKNAIYFYLVHKFSWLPKDVISMSYEDIWLILSEERKGLKILEDES